jgi:hypothetical protein
VQCPSPSSRPYSPYCVEEVFSEVRMLRVLGSALKMRRTDERANTSCIMAEENLERLERLLLEGFGEGDMSVLDEVVAEDLMER